MRMLASLVRRLKSSQFTTDLWRGRSAASSSFTSTISENLHTLAERHAREKRQRGTRHGCKTGRKKLARKRYRMICLAYLRHWLPTGIRNRLFGGQFDRFTNYRDMWTTWNRF